MVSFLSRAATWLPLKMSVQAARPPAQFRTVYGRSGHWTALVLLSALAAVSWPLHAADAPLTLSQAQHLAAERSRRLAAHDKAISASREMAVAAGELPDPMLQLGIDNLPVNGPDQFSVTRDFMTMRRIGVMQEMTRGEKRELRSERFEREAERGFAEKAATLASIQRDTALAWLDRYYAEAAADIIAEQRKEARLQIEVAENAYRSGHGAQADVYAARSTLVTLDDRASEVNRRVRSARTALARWVGEAADAPLAGMPAINAVRLDAHSLESDLAHHPQIAVLARQEEIAETEAKLAQANKKADWSVELMYNQRGPMYSNMVSFGVSVPLQWNQKNRQDRELAAKLAMAEQARAQREESLRAHIAEVRVMLDEWENGRERRARYQRELIPLARQRTQAALAAYRGAKAGLNDVLTARRNEIDVRMQALQLDAETARVWAQLNFLFPDEGLMRHTSAATGSHSNWTEETQ